MAEETAPNQGATGGVGAGPEGATAYDARPEAGGESPLSAGTHGEDGFSSRPEIFVGAAFVGGFALAQILKRVGR
jgi:hypothetical protein